MPIVTDAVLETYFESGDKPTQQQFYNLIASKAHVNDMFNVGNTTIQSGTAGRVFFQNSSNKFAQDSNFYFDETNKRLGIGVGASPTAKLHVKTTGSLSSDYAILAKNFGDVTIFQATGDGGVFGKFIGAGGTPDFNRELRVYGNTQFNDSARFGPNLDSNMILEGNTADQARYATTANGKHRFTNNGTDPFFELYPAGKIVSLNWLSGSPSALLDILSTGALTTDVSLRIRNSINSADIMKVTGDGNVASQNFSTGTTINSAAGYYSDSGKQYGAILYGTINGLAAQTSSINQPAIEGTSTGAGGEGKGIRGTASGAGSVNMGVIGNAINGSQNWAFLSQNGLCVLSNTTDYYTIGQPGVAGSWRMKIDGDDLVFERFESGSWVQKGIFAA